MEENGATSTTASQESVKDTVEPKPEQCVAICVRQNSKSVQGEQSFINICENINEFNPREWKCIAQHGRSIVLVKRDLSKSFEFQLYDLFVLSKYQAFTSSDNTSSNAGASAVDPCDCFNTNSILKNILNSASTDQWVCFWICHGITCVSIADEKTSIPVENFNQLETLVGQLIKLNNDVTNILNTRVPLGETENDATTVITTHIISQEEFFKEMNEIVFQKRRTLKQLNTLVHKHCGIVEVVEDGQDSTNNKDGPSNVAPVQAYGRSTGNNDELRALQAGSSIPLRTLLQCIVTRLTTSNWEELRRYVGRDIPLRVIRNVPNGIEFFQELENRDMIQIGQTEYIRNGLYEIERVDLVHLLDCIQDGDYSLLHADAVSHALEQRNRSEDRSSNLGSRTQPYVRQMRNLTVDRRRNDNTADQDRLWSPSGANTQSSVSEVRELAMVDGHIARSPLNMTGNNTSDVRDRPLQRRYRNVPQRTTPSSPYPVQEDTEPASSTGPHERSPETGTSVSVESTQEQTSANISNDDGDRSVQTTNTNDTSIQGTNAEGSTPQSTNSEGTLSRVPISEDTPPQGTNSQSTLPQGANAESTLPRDTNTEGTLSRDENAEDTLPPGANAESTLSLGENAEDTRTWLENREYSCEHYDRYCNVQFACCERFWPCHRCHNSNSQCGQRKLRSRDIKKLKCRRCGKVQEFPKDSPHCVECNLKFAEYFCSICQHLTGVQNHPFHCVKCGICRVHGDRSFHCDICGVCLDVNLRGNHKCREGSAHDECCICFEDAFTGCQILPCSHKVHKECANQMLRSGMTRCPICRESFAHKMGKNKKI